MLRLILVLSVHSIAHQALASEPLTKVVVNGLMSPVYFNDGDTFRVRPSIGAPRAPSRGLQHLGVVRSGAPVGRLELS